MCNLTEWFDVENIHHVRAYKHVCDTGVWPEGFIPENVNIDLNWQVLLLNKMADAWVADMLDTCEVL